MISKWQFTVKSTFIFNFNGGHTPLGWFTLLHLFGFPVCLVSFMCFGHFFVHLFNVCSLNGVVIATWNRMKWKVSNFSNEQYSQLIEIYNVILALAKVELFLASSWTSSQLICVLLACLKWKKLIKDWHFHRLNLFYFEEMKSTQDGQLKLTYFANSSRSVAKDSKKKYVNFSILDSRIEICIKLC